MCEADDWFKIAYYAFLAVIALNIPAAILFGVPMYYSWGLVLSI